MASAWRLIVAALLIVAGVVGWFLWQAESRREQEKRRADQAEAKLGLDAARVLTATFDQVADLRVATLSGKSIAQGECQSGNFIPNQQRTSAPYSAAYFVDLSRVDRSSYRWNGESRTIFVTVPDVRIDTPNINMSRAKTDQTGIFVSRSCGSAMQRQVAGRLQAVASERAKRPEYLQKARESARATLGNLTRAPLAAAGVGRVSVVVRFPSDPPLTNGDRSDVTRSLQEVLADPKYG